MPEAYYYSSVAAEMALSGSVSGSATTLIVDGVAGLPSATPFKLVIDPGLSTEEIVKVTEVSGTTLTVVRGWDGSSGQAHSNLAVVRHGVTAEDFRLSRQHEAATTAHGTASAVVGISDAQALTNKDLSSSTNTFPSTLATDSEVANAVSAHAASKTTHGVSGELMGTSSAQTVTNKNLTSTTNTFPSTLATTAALASHTGATAAHGATGAVVGTTNVQTLTNKTINGANNTLTNVPQSAVTGLAAALADSGWGALTPGANYGAVSGHALRYRKIGNRVTVTGMVSWDTGLLAGSTIATLPSSARPAATTWLCTAVGSGTTCVMQLMVGTNGIIQIPSGYYTGTPEASMAIRVSGSFLID